MIKQVTSQQRRSIREEHAEATRQRILEALADHLAEQGDKDFSFPALAKRAGVSIPTVYRHFPSRDALMDGFAEWARQQYGFSSYEFPADELPKVAQVIYTYFEQHEALTRAMMNSAVGREFNTHARAERLKALEKTLRSVTGKFEPVEARRVLAIFQLFLSAHAWHHIKENVGLDAAESSQAVGWAMRVLLKELRRNPKTFKETT